MQKSSCLIASENSFLIPVFPSPFWRSQTVSEHQHEAGKSCCPYSTDQEREVQKCAMIFSSTANGLFFSSLSKFSNTKRQNVKKQANKQKKISISSSFYLLLPLPLHGLAEATTSANTCFLSCDSLPASLLTSGNALGITWATLSHARKSLLSKDSHWTCLIHPEMPRCLHLPSPTYP